MQKLHACLAVIATAFAFFLLLSVWQSPRPQVETLEDVVEVPPPLASPVRTEPSTHLHSQRTDQHGRAHLPASFRQSTSPWVAAPGPSASPRPSPYVTRSMRIAQARNFTWTEAGYKKRILMSLRPRPQTWEARQNTSGIAMVPFLPHLEEEPERLWRRYIQEPGLRMLIGMVERMAKDTLPGSGCVSRGEYNASMPWTALCAAQWSAGPALRRRFSFREFLAAPDEAAGVLVRDREYNHEHFRNEAFPALENRGYKSMADGQCDPGIQHFIKYIRHYDRNCKWHLPGLANRSIVYLFFDCLETFQRQLQLLSVHIFIIAGMHDHPVYPLWLLNSPWVLRLFTDNVERDVKHPKIVPLPLALMYNTSCGLSAARARARAVTPSKMLYSRFDLGGWDMQTRMGGRWNRRRPLMSVMRKQGFPNMTARAVVDRISKEEFRETILQSKFVLCPPGEGLDSYRIWETFHLGRVPLRDARVTGSAGSGSGQGGRRVDTKAARGAAGPVPGRPLGIGRL